MKDKATKLGLGCLWGWCFFSALARVITSQVTQQISPSALCFYLFLISSTVFFMLNIRNTNITFRKAIEPENLKNIFWLNLNTFGAWFFLIYPLKFIQPAMVSSITMGFGPMATLIFGFFIYESNKMNFFDILVSFLLLAIIIFIIGLCFANVTTLATLAPINVFWAISACFIVGFSTAAGNIYAKKLSNNQFNPREILAVRFFMTVILAAAISIFTGDKLILSHDDFVNILMVAGVLVIMPLYLVQIGIKHLEPITVSITAPLMPVLVVFFELLAHHHFSKWAILSVIMIFLLMMFNIYSHLKENKKIKRYKKIQLKLNHGS